MKKALDLDSSYAGSLLKRTEEIYGLKVYPTRAPPFISLYRSPRPKHVKLQGADI